MRQLLFRLVGRLTRIVRGKSITTNKLLSYQKHGEKFHSDGVRVLDENWDNLIILDGCRYDEFERLCDIPGELEKRRSVGSMSEEFIRGNFRGRQEHDTVYVSTNPWYAKISEEIDASIHNFIFVNRDAYDGYTSFPSTVTDTALRANERYPDKRLIVHYLQPHEPYFDEDSELFKRPGGFPSELRNADISHETIMEAYRTTLETVLGEVAELVETFEGKTVITADHGELLGDRCAPIPVKHYGHPRGNFVDSLIEVPWFVVDGEERKQIKESEPIRDDGSDEAIPESVAEDQLEALGYRF